MVFDQDRFEGLEKTLANQQLELNDFQNELQNTLLCNKNEVDGIVKHELQKLLEDGTLTTNENTRLLGVADDKN
eukprot:CAMPEP_0194367926 /NCGR_PEP_ID=MMETSP0174-20130528/16118_1 /TAXON_ID=216777 /ORGANISM="Proboscia alata, Strain PI-D3" /LENGTH=73 /DNA_ID=CAMNT_0039144015 /DNA_START=31 /DNA_END=249 /DNA_ORIENTATION=+